MNKLLNLKGILTLALLLFSTHSLAIQIIYFGSVFEAEAFCQNHDCLHVIRVPGAEPQYKVIYREIQQEPPAEEPPGEDSPPEEIIYTFNKGVYFFDELSKASQFCAAQNCISDVYEYHPYSPNPPYHHRTITVYVVHAAYTISQQIQGVPEIKMANSLREVINICYSSPAVRCSRLNKLSDDSFRLIYGRTSNIQYPTPTPMPIKPGEEKEDPAPEVIVPELVLF